MCDCKICEYGLITLYKQQRNRTTGVLEYVPRRIECSKPSYGKRTFLVKEKTECGEYKRRERNGAK